MSNHLHLVLRTLPEAVATWTDAEVARRWLRLFPGQTGLRTPGQPPLSEDQAIEMLCLDQAGLHGLRRPQPGARRGRGDAGGKPVHR
jgi:hypothetical protein